METMAVRRGMGRIKTEIRTEIKIGAGIKFAKGKAVLPGGW